MRKLKKTMFTILAALSVISGSSGELHMSAAQTSTPPEQPKPVSPISQTGTGQLTRSKINRETRPFSSLIYFGEEGAPTRETAALIAFEYLISAGWEVPEEAGNLSMFEDGKIVSPEAAPAMAELVRLGVLASVGGKLLPRKTMTQAEARKLAEDVIDLKTAGANPLGALVPDITAQEAFAGRLRCVLSAMLSQGKERLEGAPDASLATLAIYLAYTSGGLPEAVCRFSGRNAVIITQTGYVSAYNSLFAGGEPCPPVPSATGDNMQVLGEYIVFWLGDDMGITLSCGTLMRDGEEGFSLWCTLRRDGEYLCTAKVGLEPREGTLPVVSSAEFAWG